MEAGLERIPFTRADLPVVRNFFCGQEEWALYVANWIRGKPDGVLEALDDGTEVWLYLDEYEQIVGYGSLGVTSWLYPNPYEGERATLAVIPAVAVQARFHGLPKGDWRQHYSSLILSDLIELARDRYKAGRFPDPLLGLFVDTRNTRASDFYKRHGFENYAKSIRDKTGTVWNQRMKVSLLERPATSATSRPLSEGEQQLVKPTVAPAAEEQPRTFEDAVSAVLNAPPLPEQQTKKDAAKARREERKRQKQQASATSARKRKKR